MPSPSAWRRSALQRAGPAAREHLRPVVQAVEILADHRRIIERRAVLGDQARDLAERIVSSEIGIRLDRAHRSGDRLDPVVLASLDRHRHDLARVWRCHVVVQLHGPCLPSPGPLQDHRSASRSPQAPPDARRPHGIAARLQSSLRRLRRDKRACLPCGRGAPFAIDTAYPASVGSGTAIMQKQVIALAAALIFAPLGA